MDYKELVEIKKAINQTKVLLAKASDGLLFDDVKNVLFDAVSVINMKLYGSKEVCFSDGSECNKDLMQTLFHLVDIWEQSIERRAILAVDRDFWYLYERFKYVNIEDIKRDAISLFESYPKEYKEVFTDLPKRYTFLTGKLDFIDRDYSLVSIYANMMKENIENFKWLYNRLADFRSKQILLRIVKYWFTFNLNDLGDLHENIFSDYYDLDIIKYNENEVLVDCGAYIGDSITEFINTYGAGYKRIYGYEIDPVTLSALKKNVEGLHDIVLKQKGVGSKQGKMFIEQDGAGTRVCDRGEIEVSVTTLDDDIDEPVSLIKMDIEGAETDAIEGARKHIMCDKPKLLICTYHKPNDIFTIPHLINCIRDDYKFYLRFNGRGIWPCDHVLFAV